MSQALYTSMSGINAGTTQIQVISNNVANINTTAFKASSVNFSDVYSTTISYGSVASGMSGGTNPVQIGVGVKTSAISKDFSSGSVISTGKETDLMIQGKGFFAVRSTDNQIYYTRAGDFSWDNKGNLVTSSGYKVMGTDNIYKATTSGHTVYVPNSIISVVGGNAAVGATMVSDLNGLDTNITEGIFTVRSTVAGVTADYPIDLRAQDLDGDVTELVARINSQLGTADIVASASTAGAPGRITFTTADDSNITALQIGIVGDVSNFSAATGLNNSAPTVPVAGSLRYASNVLDWSCRVTDVTSAAIATSVNSISINQDGSIQATYQNGDTLSVKLRADGETYEFVYTTEEGVEISGSSLDVTANVAVPANFVIQLATVTNTDGLLSVGNNLFKAGPNSGTIGYTVGNQMGAGGIASGSLESSNVDLSEELSNMILAQRAVQANSRVFTTTSNVLETVTNMGR